MKKKNKKRIETDENKVVKKFITILVIVIVSVVGIYFFTRAFVSKDLFAKKDNNSSETAEVEFNYDKTILGSTFNRPYDEYYVIVYKSSDEKASELATIINNYNQKEEHLKLYFADLDDHLNKDFYDIENINPKATKASELKVGNYTLIKIKDKAISKYIEGIDKIENELK